MTDKWLQGMGLTAVHRILSEREKNGNGMEAGQSARYICMARHRMGIARKAKNSIFILVEMKMADPHKLTITTGTFHVSWIMAWLTCLLAALS
jgi:hypothetical protein